MKESNWIEAAKYLSNEMDDKEISNFEKWLDSDSEIFELFKKIKMDWENFEGVETDVDTLGAWNKLENRLKEDGLLKENKSIFLNNVLGNAVRIAAVLIILLVAGYFVVTFSLNNKNIIQTANNEFQTIELPDGSVISLYQNSKISYDKDFISETRTIKLEGEAFFEVEKLNGIPFIVKTETAQIKVLGTSFNVATQNIDHNVEVFVNTGLVELKSKMDDHNSIQLTPGDIGCCTKGKLEKLENSNENYIAWKTHDLVFKNTSLNEVINVVEKVYMVDIEYDKNELDEFKITTSFNKQKLETILDVISKTFNLSYSKNNNEVYLEKMN